MLKPYKTLLRTPGALKFSLAGFIGRMPIAMDSLAIIFIVVAATDSYALAGALTAVGSIVDPGIAKNSPLRLTISIEAFNRARGVPISNQ